jgi:flagella basal body P-ring formation protein FlgA
MITALTSLFLSGVSIVLPMEATANGSEIEIGEIATISGTTPAVVDAIRAIAIGRSPLPRFARTIDRGQIRSKILAQFPDVEIQFSGRTATRVGLAVVTVPREQFIAAVDAELLKLVKTRDITWIPARDLGALVVPMGDSEGADDGKGAPPELRVVLEGADLVTGPMNVTVRVLVNGVTWRSVFGAWDIQVWEQLPVLVRNLPAGTRVNSALFRIQRTVVPPGGVGSVLTPASMVGAIAMRGLSEGNVVVEGDVTRPRVIHEGDMVTLIVKKGSIRAEVMVIALETGSIGDTITVRRTDTGLELTGVIMAPDRVMLDLNR